MSIAMLYRPEVGQALDQIKAGCVRVGMSKKEMLPVLNVITETYSAGLQNKGSIGDAWTDQFAKSTPSYAFGAQFETPLGNRAAKARNDRRVLEARQLQNQYETTLKTLQLEVGVAVRESRASYQSLEAQSRALAASNASLETVVQRWKLLPGDDGNGSLVLDNMLRAQERLMRAESAYMTNWVGYNLSLINLKKATGELLQQEQVTWCEYRDECEGIKTRVVTKPDLGATSPSVR